MTTYVWTGTAGHTWENSANWNPNGIPSTSGDTAGFNSATTVTALSVTGPYQMGGITFDAGAPSYTIEVEGIPAQFGSDGLAFLGAGIVDNSGVQQNFISDSAIQFDNSSSAADANFIVNYGGFVQFFDTSSGGTAQIILEFGGILADQKSSGSLSIGSLAGAGTVVFTTASQSLIVGSLNTSTVFSGAIDQDSADGSLTKVGTGTLTLSGASNYTLGTTISAGTLQLGDGGTSGSIDGSVTDNSIFAIDRSNSFTFSGAITGTGAFQQIGVGTTIFNTAESYGGGTTITAGTLRLGDGGADGTIDGGVTDNATFAIDRSDVFTFSNAISGTGGFDKIGGGTTVFNTTQNYSGGTTIGAGTLQLGDGGADGTIVGNVTDNAALAIDRSDTFTFSNAISGTGSFKQIGNGTTVFNTNQNFSGGTTISAGTLQLGDGGVDGSITGGVTDNAIFAIGRSDVFTFSNAISGTGVFDQIGVGTTVFNTTQNYSGGTTIGAGTLQLGDGGADGAIAGSVTDNATFAVDRSNTLTLAGAISGAGAFKQIGVGTTIFNNTESYGGGTTISAGTLQLGDGGADGVITGSVTDNATFAIDRSDVFTFSNAISGTGAFAQIGGGTTVFNTTQNYSGGTTIGAGTLQFGDGGADGTIVGNVTDNAALAIDRSDTFTFSNAISGTGSFKQIGNGTTVFNTNQNFSGGTTISAGTLQLGDGGADGSITGGVTDNATFAIDRSDTFSFGGDISGTGAFDQIGTGTTILTAADSATSTVIDAGAIELGNGGSIAGSVTFNGNGAGATLRLDTSSSQIGGAIANFGASDSIDLGFLAFSSSIATTWQENGANTGGTLTLSNGVQTLATFNLIGQYAANAFTTESATLGGTAVIFDAAPVVTPAAPNVSATPSATFASSSLFSASAAGGDPVTSYEVEDESKGPNQGFWVLNGQVLPNGQLATISAAQLSELSFVAGASASGSVSDTLDVAAANAFGLGALATFTVTASHFAPGNTAPVVTASNRTAAPGTLLSAASLFSAVDADGDTIVSYEVDDTTSDSGSWILDGVAEPSNTVIDVTSAQLSGLIFEAGYGVDDLMVRANDGTQWGSFANFTVTPPPNAAPPAGTAETLVMSRSADGAYEFYDVGHNAILLAGPLGQIDPALQVAGVGGFDGSDTADLLLRDPSTGAFTLYDVSNNNIAGHVSFGQVGPEWTVSGFGDFSSHAGETDMLMRNSDTGAFEVYDISNNAITSASGMGQVGLEWQVAGFGDFSTRAGETDMLMRNSNTGAFDVFDVVNNTITSAGPMGQVGLEWSIAGFGDFSTRADETDMLMRNSNTGAFEVFDISNNNITSEGPLGQVGLEWTIAGFGDFSGNANETDMLMRNTNTGAFELYDISNNAITLATGMGQVGGEWSVGGIAADQATGSLSAPNAQLTQAMASFAPTGAAPVSSVQLDQGVQPAAPNLFAAASSEITRP